MYHVKIVLQVNPITVSFDIYKHEHHVLRHIGLILLLWSQRYFFLSLPSIDLSYTSHNTLDNHDFSSQGLNSMTFPGLCEPWGYISMQNVRPFPQLVLQEMTGNPKFDPFHYVKVVPKLEKSTDHDHNLIISESGQDTSVCRISYHSLHAFSR